MSESESLHSIIHTLHKYYKEKEVNAMDLAVIDSEAYSEKEERSSNGEKGDSFTSIMSSESSGYVTEGSFFSESLISETSTFITDSLNQEKCFKKESLDKEYTQKDPSPSPPFNSESNSENSNQLSLSITQDKNFRQTHNKNIIDEIHNSEQAHCALLPQDYIVPVLSTSIFFNFPSDM